MFLGLHGLPKRSGKLKDVTKFDAAFFGYHPKEASAFYETVFSWSFYESDGYHLAYKADKPYLDGFKAIFAKKQSLRVQAVRGDRAHRDLHG